jgi:hypothetical protein
MKPSVFFRVSAVLVVLFAAGHTLGFRQTVPEWKVDAVVESMKQVHFQEQGFTRSYYDFYEGFGYFVTAYMLLAAVWLWILAGLPRDLLRRVVALPWALTGCFLITTLMGFRYFFAIQIVFGALLTLLVAIGSWLAMRTTA